MAPSFFSALTLSVAALSAASTTPSPSQEPATSQAVSWSPCVRGGASVLCGSLKVPLDYTDSKSVAARDFQIDLVKVAAKAQPSKGSILFNFGGPGDEGENTIAQLGPRLLNSTGGQFDLVSFNPRGTSKELLFSCFANDIARQRTDLQLPANLFNSSDTAKGRLWAESRIRADLCQSKTGVNGTLIGTAFVARDLIEIATALDKDGLLRYWGFSYGSTLGATVASMFPDKVDKIILDGVVNAHEYYHSEDVEKYTETDNTFLGLLEACVTAGPAKCALASFNQSAQDLDQKLRNFVLDLKYNPPVGLGAVIDWSSLKRTILSLLYRPASYPALAKGLGELVAGNTDAAALTFSAELSPSPGDNSSTPPPEALYGIKCSDRFDRYADRQELEPFYQAILDISFWGGEAEGTTANECAVWKSAAKERYAGDFHVKTRNPILLLSNSHDPVTPLASAHNMSAGFECSVVLEQNGFGHTSIAQPSKCTDRYAGAYFVNGTLPAKGTVCQVDSALFP